MQIKIITLDKILKVYFNESLHLTLKLDDLIGIQSWIEGDINKKYFIEYYLKDNSIQCEYNVIEKWLTILDLLDKENLFRRVI